MKYHCFYCRNACEVRSEDAYHSQPEEEYHVKDDGYILWRAKQDRGDSE